MLGEFYSLARFQMALPGNVESVDGGLIPSASLPYHTLTRRKLERDYPYLAKRLLDPQLYLVSLANPALARKACANLSSYGWFPVTVERQFASSQQRQADWNKGARANIHREWLGEVQKDPLEIG